MELKLRIIIGVSVGIILSLIVSFLLKPTWLNDLFAGKLKGYDIKPNSQWKSSGYGAYKLDVKHTLDSGLNLKSVKDCFNLKNFKVKDRKKIKKEAVRGHWNKVAGCTFYKKAKSEQPYQDCTGIDESVCRDSVSFKLK